MTRNGVRLAVATAVLLVIAVVVLVVVVTRSGDDGLDAPDAAPSASATSTAPSGSALFGDPPADADGLAPDTSLGTPTRSRYVSFRPEVLPTTADGSRLVLDFFPDATFTGAVEHVDRQSLLTTWSGPVDGEPEALFAITQTSAGYQVTVSSSQGSFTMNQTATGLYQVEEVDQPDVVDSGAATPTGGANP